MMSRKVCLEFAEKVINPGYPGGISPTIKDLTLKAVGERKRQETRIATVKELDSKQE